MGLSSPLFSGLQLENKSSPEKKKKWAVEHLCSTSCLLQIVHPGLTSNVSTFVFPIHGGILKSSKLDHASIETHGDLGITYWKPS